MLTDTISRASNRPRRRVAPALFDRRGRRGPQRGRDRTESERCAYPMACTALCSVKNTSPRCRLPTHMALSSSRPCPRLLTSSLGTLCCHLVGHGDRDLGGAGVWPPRGGAGWRVSVQAVGDHSGGSWQEEERGESSETGPREGRQAGEGHLGTEWAVLSRQGGLERACIPETSPAFLAQGGLS